MANNNLTLQEFIIYMKILTIDNSNNKLYHVNNLGTPNGKENKLIEVFLNLRKV